MQDRSGHAVKGEGGVQAEVVVGIKVAVRGILTKVQGNDSISWCWHELGYLFRFLLEFGKEHVRCLCALTEEFTSDQHVSGFEKRLHLVHGEHNGLLFNVTETEQ